MMSAPNKLGIRKSTDTIVWSYVDSLELLDLGEMSKGGRTRVRLKIAAASILASKGYQAMQMGDICREAGLSQGGIYRHFENKTAIALEVLTELLNHQGEVLQAGRTRGSVYARLYEANLLYVQLFKHDAGLMRCIRQLADDHVEFRELWQRGNGQWHRLLASRIIDHMELTKEAHDSALFLAHSVAAMTDEMLHEAYVRKNEEYSTYRDSPEKFAEMISVAWYRAVYLENPPREELRWAAPMLGISKKDMR